MLRLSAGSDGKHTDTSEQDEDFVDACSTTYSTYSDSVDGIHLSKCKHSLLNPCFLYVRGLIYTHQKILTVLLSRIPDVISLNYMVKNGGPSWSFCPFVQQLLDTPVLSHPLAIELGTMTAIPIGEQISEPIP